jgi:hypothetical protein
MKEHGWKAKWATVSKSLRNTSQRIRFNDLGFKLLLDVTPQTSVFRAGVEPTLQFLHSSGDHFRSSAHVFQCDSDLTGQVGAARSKAVLYRADLV